jgi:dipeptide/tripeptide permease
MSEATTKGATSWLESVKLGRVFWLLCSMEMWERLAYYGLRVVVPIYIAQADEPGGLHFSQVDKGIIYFWWAIFQSVLPSFTGGYADRYGYKKTIFVSITLKVIGYLLMGTQRTFFGFMAGVLFLATGTALFKPGIQGSLAHTLPKEKASSGWGVFYWLVNVGAMLGPPLAGMLKKMTWPWVFYGCAIIVSLNYLMLFTYADPDPGTDNKDGPGKVFVETMKNLWDGRLIAVLLILAGFWMMMYQLWDLHPNFIADWIDSQALAAYVPDAWTHQTDRGTQVLQENLLNLNAALIVLFIVPLSVMVRKMRTLRAMLIGMIIATGGILVSATSSGWILALAILLFSTGEMLTGPKKLELFGLIAPPGKKALYLGYVNIPVGIGQAVGGLLMGWVYGSYGEKATLAYRYLAEKTDYLAQNGRPAWDGNIASLDDTVGVPRKVAYETMKSYTGLDGPAATDLLWQTYEPYRVWYVLAAVGVVCAIALVIFIRMTAKDERMNV